MIATLAGQAVLIVSGVIVARMLGPENRGYLALLILVPIIVGKVGALGMPLAVTYYVARDRAAAGAIWATLRPVVILQCGLMAGVHSLALWLLVEGEPQYVIDAALLTVLLVPAALAQDYGLALLQGRGRFTALNVLRFAPLALYAAGVAVLLLLNLDGLGEVAAVWSGTNVLLAAVTLLVGLRGIGPPGEGAAAPSVASMAAFGAKGVLGANSPVETYRLDQAVVGLFLTPVSLGLYSVALAFTNLPRAVGTGVGIIAYPNLAELTDPVAARRKLWRFFGVTVVVCAALVVGLELLAGWLVPFFFGDEFEDSVPLLRILLISALLVAARRVLTDGARGLGLPGLGTVAEIVSFVVLLPALVVFIDAWGVEGVALALVASGAASLLVMLAGLARGRGRHAPEGRAKMIRGPALSSRRRRRSARAALGPLGTATMVGAVLAIDGIAVVAVVVSPMLGMALALALLLCLATVSLRRRVDMGVGEIEPPVAESSSDEGLAPARGLYYLGCLMVGFLVIRTGVGVTVSDLLFLFALGLTALTLIAGRQPAPVFMGPMLFLGVALFAAGGLLSSFGADSPGESVLVVARVIYLTMVWFLLGAVLLTRPAHVRTAIGFWVASAALGGAGAVVQTLFGDVIPGGQVNYGRVSGFVYQVNDLGGLCAVAAIPAAMLVTRARTPGTRLAATTALLLIVAGLLLSSSVSGVVAVAGAGAVWLSIARRRLRVVIPLAVAVVALSAFAASNNRYWESPLERLGTASSRTGTADSTLFTRVYSYEAAWETIEDSPLVGVGLTREGADTATGSAVHNVFLGAWYQAGFIGMLGLLIVAGYAVVAAWRAVVDARDPGERATAQALFSAVLAFLLFAQAQPTLFQRYGWMSVALVVAVRGIQLRATPVRAGPQSQVERAAGVAAPAT